MAIQKSKTLSNGVTGDYWRLLDITFDRTAFLSHGRIALFKDKATSDAGGTHLGLIKSFSFSFALNEIMTTTNVIAYMYTKIQDKANTTISTDLEGNVLGSPISYDSDIAGGVPV